MPKHIPQLDGVRGLAILIVITGHVIALNTGLGIKSLGALPPMGVNLFFVLSGFLITNILLETRDSSNYYLSFYARRALRIWPLYFTVLVICFAVINHRIPGFDFDQSRVRWPFFALFIQNLVYSNASMLGPLALAGTWSLAVEEQFYALWPLLVRTCSSKLLTITLVTIFLMAPAARFCALRLGIDPYINPLCRFDGMALGGLLALWIRHYKPSRALMARITLWMLLAATAGELVTAKIGMVTYLSKTFVNIAFCALLLASLAVPLAITTMNMAWLRYMGKISYGAYLLHGIIAVLIYPLIPSNSVHSRLLRSACILLGTVCAASLSWHCFESKALRLKRLFPAKCGPVFAGDTSPRLTSGVDVTSHRDGAATSVIS
jgi:peptidoglycan/LPS O-acetylase OafA/YrhL